MDAAAPTPLAPRSASHNPSEHLDGDADHVVDRVSHEAAAPLGRKADRAEQDREDDERLGHQEPLPHANHPRRQQVLRRSLRAQRAIGDVHGRVIDQDGVGCSELGEVGTPVVAVAREGAAVRDEDKLPPSCVVQPCVLHVLVSSSQNLHSKAVVQPASLALAGCPTHLPVVLVPCLSGTVMLIGVCVPLTLISLRPCRNENEMSELASVTFVSPVAGSEVADDTGGAPRKLTVLLYDLSRRLCRWVASRYSKGDRVASSNIQKCSDRDRVRGSYGSHAAESGVGIKGIGVLSGCCVVNVQT